VPAQIRLLNEIFGVFHRSEHAIRNAEEARSVLIEDARTIQGLGHRNGVDMLRDQL